LVAVIAPSAAAQGQPTPKVEIFGGYSFYHPGLTIDSFSLENMPAGWGGAVTFNFARHFGLTADFGGHYKTMDFSSLVGSPASAKTHIGTVMFGPHVEFRTERLTPFAEALFGLHRIALPDNGFSDNAFGLAVGGGLDVHVSRHLDLRLVQADFVHSSHDVGATVTPFGTTSSTSLDFNGVRVQTGINILLAVPPAGPPPSAACTVDPAEVFAGEPVRATATARDFNPKHKLSYSLNATGGKLQAQDTTANIDTTGLNPGSYTVTATVNDTRNKKATAQCNATYTVKERPKHPPQISCSANPATVQSGTAVTITCDCKTPDTDPGYGNITVNIANWSASGGRISGSGNTATLDTAGAPAGPITVTAVCTDSRGLTSNGSATVNVEVPPPPPQVSKLNEIAFKRNSARVDNTAKAILDDVALRLQRDADAKAVIVGYQDAKERGKNLAAQRAANAKEYLVKEKGIDAARIETRIATGATGMKDEIYLVPAGAAFSEPNTEVSSVGATKAPYGRPRAAPRAHKAKKALATKP
jgi:outer membrane protein OmpA-like peptidoglycan-associated protein/opacity protein-like surface antigen